MLRSEAARYARWSAAIALALVAMTTIVYLQRGWVRHKEKKAAPPPAPVDVSRQSAGITFRKGEGNQTIFEVAASHSMEFKGQDANLLEDVRITIFGRAGDRHDVIHTQSCRYGKQTGEIVCGGDVQIDLLSAADAARARDNPGELAAHVETRGVRFDRATGLAETDQPVTFKFPTGNGMAVGLEYRSEEGTVHLLHDVRFAFTPNASRAAKASAPRPKAAGLTEIRIQGNSLDFGRDTRILRLHGPAQADTPIHRLTAEHITIHLDDQFRLEKFIASGTPAKQPSITSRETTKAFKLAANTLTAQFAPGGWLRNVQAEGALHGSRTASVNVDDATADSGSLEFWPEVNQLKEIRLSGNVMLKAETANPMDSRILQTSSLRMQFVAGEQGASGKAQRAETLGPGNIEWTEALPAGGSAQTKLQADRLAIEFSVQGKAKQLIARGNTQTQRSLSGRPPQTATARNGTADLLATGGWSQMDLDGDVHLREADRNGQGDHAVFVRVSQTATLTGSAVIRDTGTETRAPRITFFQADGEIRAEGGVRSTEFASRGAAVQLAPAPVNITANTLQANSRTGHALYSGKARLWQGDSVLEADSIELLRSTRTLNAIGNVRAVFPQVPRQAAGNAPDRASGRADTLIPTSVSLAQTKAKKTQLWHATCGTLTYQDLENRAHLEQNVIVQSPEQRIRARFLDLYFQRANPSTLNPGTQTENGASSPLGPQQVSRAIGSGGVIVEQGSRKASADRGEYIASDGKFVMNGGNPTLYDGSAGTTTGRQLTFFLADDTIIVDSENGSRTVTKHRVEK